MSIIRQKIEVLTDWNWSSEEQPLFLNHVRIYISVAISRKHAEIDVFHRLRLRCVSESCLKICIIAIWCILKDSNHLFKNAPKLDTIISQRQSTIYKHFWLVNVWQSNRWSSSVLLRREHQVVLQNTLTIPTEYNCNTDQTCLQRISCTLQRVDPVEKNVKRTPWTIL